MNFIALLLFGSRARGDQSKNSDIDLLSVVENEAPSVTGPPQASLYQYSPSWLESKAKDGDLFIWHLVSEALPIYDPADRLGVLKSQFRFKSNYDEQISKASDVAWMIVRFGEQIPPLTANRWLAWSVRTISIARAADQRTPAFSANALVKAHRYQDIFTLVAQKDAKAFSTTVGMVLRDFLLTFGITEPSSYPQTLSDFDNHFLQSGNLIGRSILKEGDGLGIYV